jgi:hypothetical protein
LKTTYKGRLIVGFLLLLIIVGFGAATAIIPRTGAWLRVLTIHGKRDELASALKTNGTLLAKGDTVGCHYAYANVSCNGYSYIVIGTPTAPDKKAIVDQLHSLGYVADYEIATNNFVNYAYYPDGSFGGIVTWDKSDYTEAAKHLPVNSSRPEYLILVNIFRHSSEKQHEAQVDMSGASDPRMQPKLLTSP